MSAVIGAILKHAFCGKHDPMMAGVMLDLAGGRGQIRMFLKFGMYTGDELAIQEVLCTRGANAEKPCFECLNVKNKHSSDFKEDVSGYFVDHTELDVRKLKFHSDSSIRRTFTQLRARYDVEEPTAFTDTQKHLGFTFHHGALLLDPKLTTIFLPVSHVVFDWMHIVFVHGVFGQTFGQMMMRMRRYEITYSSLHDYLQLWQWPGRVKSRGVTGKGCCDPTHATKWYSDGQFHPSASESLSLYSVIAYYFMNSVGVDSGVLVDEVVTFLLLCDLIDELLLISRKDPRATPDVLMSKTMKFLRQFMATYGPVDFTWKFHALIHLPWMFAQHLILFACFVHERKHKLIKRYAKDIYNTSQDYERSVICEITDHHLSLVESHAFDYSPRLFDVIKKPSQAIVATLREEFGDALAGRLDIKLGKSARYNEWGIMHVGDVIYGRCDGEVYVGRAYYIASVAGEILIGLERWVFVAATKGGSRWRTSTDDPIMMDAMDVMETLIWSVDRGIATVIMPPWLPSL
jgi:hypothetical protein